MVFDDNREFIKALKKGGDLVSIKEEIDWDGEAGAILRRANERREPAPFFEKIKDYPGHRMFGGALATNRRLAIAMGLPPNTPARRQQKEFEIRTEKPIKPVILKDGPCKENKLIGNEVDLFRFPVPVVHSGDGGRYVGTWHAVITRDPNSDWVNWGMYRTMAYNRKRLSILFNLGNDGGFMWYHKFLPQKKPMPFAIAVGADPLCLLATVAAFRKGESEVDYAGALRGKPVELVKCETNDLYVPAHAEIILEGEISPDIVITEGPFGEYTGYRTPGEKKHLGLVKAITYRNNPITTFANPGIPQDDDMIYNLTTSVAVKRGLERHGVPVTDVYSPPEAVNFLLVVGIKSNADNMIKRVMQYIHVALGPETKVFIVDSDIDVFNMSQVLHAFATKCHPGHGIYTAKYPYNNKLNPHISIEERDTNQGFGVVFDCTWPGNWSRETEVPPRASFREMYPEDMTRKIVKNWKKFGYK